MDADNLSVVEAASDAIRAHGSGAVAYLCERAEIAKAAGNMDEADTWWDIALAAAELLDGLA